ncbi:MAG: hypothetical protein Q8J68_09145 [Methanolobus sp.]|nr:hypothetical protein [Methanolobus sp.]AFV24540.1 hypothetical protein Mpsy_2336 [Methanolobus psychrophilus R15]MDP2217438.1 hypothetical protein [Methanolobus sp.]
MEVELIVDGKVIEINRFVQEILGSTVLGAAGTLRGVEENCKEVSVTIKK